MFFHRFSRVIFDAFLADFLNVFSLFFYIDFAHCKTVLKHFDTIFFTPFLRLLKCPVFGSKNCVFGRFFGVIFEYISEVCYG